MFENQSPRQAYVKLRLKTQGQNRDAIGAKVTLYAGDWQQQQMIKTASSYLSQLALDLTFGLGKHRRIDKIHIRWPDGRERIFTDLARNQHYLIQQHSPVVAELDEFGLAFVNIKRGEFNMGSRKNKDIYANEDEIPRHQVSINRDFQISQYEITLAQFSRFIRVAKRQDLLTAEFQQHNNYGQNAPVVWVSWQDASAMLIPMLSATNKPMRGDCLICTAMCGNG